MFCETEAKEVCTNASPSSNLSSANFAGFDRSITSESDKRQFEKYLGFYRS